LLFCEDCRQQFSVTVGTVFEPSKVPLHTWVLAAHLLYSSNKGMSSHQLHRILGMTYKTAWFMTHRIRAVMKVDNPVMFGEIIWLKRMKPLLELSPAQRSTVVTDTKTPSSRLWREKAKFDLFMLPMLPPLS